MILNALHGYGPFQSRVSPKFLGGCYTRFRDQSAYIEPQAGRKGIEEGLTQNASDAAAVSPPAPRRAKKLHSEEESLAGEGEKEEGGSHLVEKEEIAGPKDLPPPVADPSC